MQNYFEDNLSIFIKSTYLQVQNGLLHLHKVAQDGLFYVSSNCFIVETFRIPSNWSQWSQEPQHTPPWLLSSLFVCLRRVLAGIMTTF